ncbi:MAG: hypothetical protein AB7O97_13790 [Planctomycetota bacterium]
MGILDWFRQRPASLPIAVWLDDAARTRGLLAAVRDDLEQGRSVLLVGHFPAALLRSGEALADAGIAFSTKAKWTPADAEALLRPGGDRVVAVLARALPEPAANAPRQGRPAPRPDAAPVALRLVDLHPLAAANDRVAAFARALPTAVEAKAYVSFDEPLLSQFTRPWVQTMMGALGLGPDDSIEHPAVTRSLSKALRKIERGSTGDVACDSVEEWLERNAPR